MSHEIRTPITTILGYAESSLENSLSLAQRLDYTQVIIRSSKHLLQLVNDILDVSKIEAGKLELENMEMCLFSSLNDLESIFAKMAKEKGLDFQIVHRLPLPLHIFSDPTRLSQILMNLCSNAIKFTRSGSVCVTTSCNRDGLLVIEVSDTGIGMDEQQLEKIFKPFTQADGSITRNFGGTGLGLSLARRLSELLGGELIASSQIHAGSRFVLRLRNVLPRGVCGQWIEDVTAIPSQVQATDSVHFMLKGEVLLAEDNEENRRLFSHFLGKFGMSVSAVCNGREAVQAVRNKTFDIIVMDIQMPVLGGFDAARMIREQGCAVPIIALTANALKEDREKCLQTGFTDFIAKPVEQRKIYRVLAKYLAKQANDDSIATSTLLDDDPELIEIVESFIGELTGYRHVLQQQVAANDWPALMKTLHDIKGQGASFGFPCISDAAAKAHDTLRNHDYTDVQADIARLIQVCNKVERDFNLSSAIG